jgi:hypothetical protein
MSKEGKACYRDQCELWDNQSRVVFRERVEVKKAIFDDEDNPSQNSTNQ